VPLKRLAATRNIALILAVILLLSAPSASRGQDPNARDEVSLLAVLRSDAPAADKALACKSLAVYGSARAVPDLARLLADEQLSSWARIALEAIPGPEVDEALRQAAESLQGKLLVGVINSIGVRRDPLSVELLSARLRDDDRSVASAASAALGRIGDKAAAQVLRNALANAPNEIRNDIAEGCIVCAELLWTSGQTALAVDLYDDVRQADVSVQRKMEATRGAILARGDGGLPLLVENLRSDDRLMLQMALGTAREMTGSAIGQAIADEIPRSEPARAELLISVLADRASPELLSPLLKAANEGPKQVRLAAIAAIGRVGNATCFPALLEIGQESDPELSAAAKTALVALPDESVGLVIVSGLPKAEGKRYVMLLELVGQRRVPAIDQLVAALRHRDSSVRQAALAALGNTVPPDRLNLLIEQVVGSQDVADHPVAIQALKAAAIRMPDREHCAKQLAEAMDSLASGSKAEILEILAAVGGTHALQSLAAAAKSDDAKLQDVSTRLLGEWMTIDVAPVLLDLAETAPGAKYQIRSLRGYIRVARQFTLSDDERMEMCHKALAAARQPAEQKLVLEVLKRYPGPKALELTMQIRQKPELKDEATEVALAILPKLGANTPAAKDLLSQLGLGEVQIEILKAEYGAGSTWRDVTEILRKSASNSPFIVLGSGNYNATFGGDPVSGVPKELRIDYRLDGKPGSATFSENAPIFLRPPK
jgi:HEAT repeat protein